MQQNENGRIVDESLRDVEAIHPMSRLKRREQKAEVRLPVQAGGAPKMSTALSPPNAKEFDMAKRTFKSRPTFGT